MDEQNLFPPSAVRGMTVLDR